MSLLPGGRAPFPTEPPVAGYVAGAGRGATSFTTRGDLGLATLPRKLQAPKPKDQWGTPPPGYIPGIGRGATGFSGGVSRDDAVEDRGDYSEYNFDEFSGYSEALFKDTDYDEEDRQADAVYDAIEKKIDTRRKSRREARLKRELAALRSKKPTIQQQLSDVTKELAKVTPEEWESIPDVSEVGHKKKKQKHDQLMPTPDSILLAARRSGETNTILDGRVQAGAATPLGRVGGIQTPIGLSTPLGLQTPIGPSGFLTSTKTPLYSSTPSLTDLGEARGAVLSVKLDKVMDNVSGQTVIDPKGYLTDLNAIHMRSDVDMADIKKARHLLRSVVQTNPNHAPGWIASARLEELAGELSSAKELIAEGCHKCPKNEDVWLEAARLENPSLSKSILAQALKHNSSSVKLWLEAANKETVKENRVSVLKKGIEFNPSSVRLWKEVVSLQNEEQAKILLQRAVQCVPPAPHTVDIWLALAKLCVYKEAQKVLNDARRKIPASPEIWVSAAKLEETHGNSSKAESIINRAVSNLSANGFSHDRDIWLKLAEEAEGNGYIAVCKAIIKNTMSIGVEPINSRSIWMDDAEGALQRGSIETARALYNEAIEHFKTKKSLWLALADLETAHGTPNSLEEVLKKSVKFCPEVEVLWLMAAKHRWNRGDVEGARMLLADAVKHNGFKESLSLAATKLERETGEEERARVLLQRAIQQCGTPKVWISAIQLERQFKNLEEAKKLCRQAVKTHPHEAKLWMIFGQLYLESSPSDHNKASEVLWEGLTLNPKAVDLWIVAVNCYVEKKNWVKARALLEAAKIHIPPDEKLALTAVNVENACGNDQLARHLIAKSLQILPKSGILWSRAIEIEPKQTQVAKSVDALKACEHDSNVVLTVAKLFWKDGKITKARKWFHQCVSLDPSNGEAWASYLIFEIENGEAAQQEAIMRKASAAEPNRGLKWNAYVKRVENWRKSLTEKLLGFVSENFPEQYKKYNVKL
eukprot:GHVP01022490.1.p1 GENE.GHVP01022490.1~~GHVP01022490.1.p1  ORF type:complete len:984 (+),score=204.14 GHVP01022490.1:15-2966(+)